MHQSKMSLTTLGKQNDLSLVIDEGLALQLAESQVDKGEVLANRLEDISVHLKQLNHLNQYIKLTEELNEHKKNDACPSTSNGCPIAYMQRPIRLKNIEGKSEVYDKLHLKGQKNLSCSKSTCMSSVMVFYTVSSEPRPQEEVLEQARNLLEQYFTSMKKASSMRHAARWREVQLSIEATGEYQLTEAELTFGAKAAWRNASRCIGRIQWSKLKVFDCRHVTTTKGMFEVLCNHIKYGTNKGNIRSAITIFPQRTDGIHDYRIWNSQLISYAGYKQSDGSVVGDPMNAEFTDVCLKMGWKSKGTEWDILPLVVSANGEDPELFEYPADLILEVPFSHPKYEWFTELDLRWYALPAVSSMMFDVGGIQFTAAAFSGWYMSTEIGCRNLCDTNRRNVLETVANKMKLDTHTTSSLWKDKALVEVNLAVLHSFQTRNITILDHHTASENFMKHFETESKTRNGCPADWIWIVPPLSSSVTPVYHQEFALYYLRPSFDYQHPAWRVHVWEKERGEIKPRRKFNFKQIARAVIFTSILYTRALARRIKATVLYATETGKSEQYAKQLSELLGHAFNTQIYCMSDYDISKIGYESLLLVVASTFGNGDPPENGELFSQDLYDLRENAATNKDRDFDVTSSKYQGLNQSKPLKKLSFAVFALGSTTYPNFCAFGIYLDKILCELGGERLFEVTCGDEMCGQEQTFRKWAPEVFKSACQIFNLDYAEGLSDAFHDDTLTASTVRMVPSQREGTVEQLLSKYHNKKVQRYKMKSAPRNLTKIVEDEKPTILVEIYAPGLDYEPGDHVGIFPENRSDIVNGVLKRLTGFEDPDEVLQVQVMRKKKTPNGTFNCWEPLEKIPAETPRALLTHFFDITTPAQRELLNLLADFCDDNYDTERLQKLGNDSAAYEEWRQLHLPTLLTVLEQFRSCKPPAGLLFGNLMPLQSRFYSISSSPRKVINEIHLTVAFVKYKNQCRNERFGVCSGYLANMEAQEPLYFFVRSAPGFHLPKHTSEPMILIGPGTGIAPFRSFWQELEVWRELRMQRSKVWLFFGCRTREMDLYAEEKAWLEREKILDRVLLALSRDPETPKTYVQQQIEKEFDSLYQLVVEEKGHVYVCGDVTMAEDVYQTIRNCIAIKEQKTEAEVEAFLLTLRHENRYHEDIFGITSHVGEARNKSSLRRGSRTLNAL
nr:nitric oxide synthase [Bactrocera oleae]XP_036234036.1 nitric oxide synthase [Bactrocera oleae]XP_036234073.1 nitric oxide synthase [Bactrocera oleae]XP_036234191.1 nitric oxide synthase [Bactrocera oleae]